MIGRPLPAYEKSVFINCPFDSEYRDLMLANVFSVFAHGFIPRSARETQENAEPRFARILTTIAASKYSIHDLSRSTGEGGENLASSTCRWNSGWLPLFALSEKAQIDHIDGWLWFLRAMPIKDSSPIWPGSIQRDTTPLCLRLFAKFLPGSGRWTTSWIQSHRPCTFFRASHFFVMKSPIYERRLLRRRHGPTFCWRLPRAFRSPKELLAGGRLKAGQARHERNPQTP